MFLITNIEELIKSKPDIEVIIQQLAVWFHMSVFTSICKKHDFKLLIVKKQIGLS